MGISYSNTNEDPPLKLGEAPVPSKSHGWEWGRASSLRTVQHSVSRKREESILTSKQPVSTVLGVVPNMEQSVTLTSLDLEQHWPPEGSVMMTMFHLIHLMAHRNSLLKFCSTPKNIFFANLTKKKKSDFDSFTLDGYNCVSCCHFFLFDSLREKGQCPTK